MIFRLGFPPKDFLETIISFSSNNGAEFYLYLQYIYGSGILLGPKRTYLTDF